MSRAKRTFFPGQSPLELKRNPGLTESILQHVSDDVLSESERRDDTWEFLSHIKGFSIGCYDFFKTAHSADEALKRLTQMAFGGATPNSSVLDVLNRKRKKGDNKEVLRLAKKLFKSLLLGGAFVEPIRFQSEAIQKEWEEWTSEAEKKIKKRTGRSGLIKPLPLTLSEVERRNPWECLLVYNWLTWNGGNEPGLSFYGESALVELFQFLRHGKIIVSSIDEEKQRLKKLRQRLGLVPMYYRKPKITAARKSPDKKLVEIEIQHGETTLKHSLCAHPLIIGGRQFYPLPEK